jgi:hypothetical protein
MRRYFDGGDGAPTSRRTFDDGYFEGYHIGYEKGFNDGLRAGRRSIRPGGGNGDNGRNGRNGLGKGMDVLDLSEMAKRVLGIKDE